MTGSPYRIEIPDEALLDLRKRLGAARFPPSLDPSGWRDGTSLAFMRELVNQWLHHFDWRRQEERVNRLPNRMMTVDGQDIHFIHQRGVGPSPMPLVLTHGWPGCFLEFERMIPLLTDPAAHGGDPADAFHVVVPSLPGYGFSSPPTTTGTGPREIAELWRALMFNLGYERFGAQGGDIGAAVCMWLARLFPESLTGVHLNYIPSGFSPPIDQALPPITTEEQAYLDEVAHWSKTEGAYAALHATKPQTLAFSLTDSPIGLAAWMAEKFNSWSDNAGDLESTIPMETLLTVISLYWFSQSLTSSLRLYKESRAEPFAPKHGERVLPPVGVALFPHELRLPPRTWMERVFDVQRWTLMPAGGHFAALEQPELLTKDVRAFFRQLRGSR